MNEIQPFQYKLFALRAVASADLSPFFLSSQLSEQRRQTITFRNKNGIRWSFLLSRVRIGLPLTAKLHVHGELSPQHATHQLQNHVGDNQISSAFPTFYVIHIPQSSPFAKYTLQCLHRASKSDESAPWRLASATS
ncbi:hypothetical protein PsorP6_011513 [Peronosclerospora sorghi]|uniref:Uncharacterized protein n=1 Tax=Peronosclerospora sorghi TaxID=230839 RepID=A0ACC0WLZ5_9STRA|nr:hypothetical protein PsorP6_011513 [Peronosclerospora sorghi]